MTRPTQARQGQGEPAPRGKSNPFSRMDEIPVQPPFLVRDTAPARVVERHRERMSPHGIQITPPRRSQVALNGKAALGLAFDQQEAIVDALTGIYAAKHWRDMWVALYRRWGLGDILDTILADGEASPNRVRRVLAPILLELNPTLDEEARALLFVFRAWQLRQQVVVERRAMSLIPVIAGDEMGHPISFTPVLKRTDRAEWRIGWPGDPHKESPHVIQTDDVSVALGEAFPLFNRWYFEDQKAFAEVTGRRARTRVPDHIYLVPWGYRLREEHNLPLVGDGDRSGATLEELSHGNMFRLRLPDGRQFILRGDAVGVVRQGMVAGNGRGVISPPIPTADEINRAYLSAITGRGESSDIREVPEAGDLRPFTDMTSATAYVVSIEGKGTRREIIVSWVADHPRALAVVSGATCPARAVVLLSNDGDRLGVAPISYKTRQPDLANMWATTPVANLDVSRPTDRMAVSSWAAWAWHYKAPKYLPPEGRK